MKKIIFLCICLLMLTGCGVNTITQETKTYDRSYEELVEKNNEPITMILFYGETCAYCAALKQYLAELMAEYPNIKLTQYEVRNSEENQELMATYEESTGVSATGVPYLVIGDDAVVGNVPSEVLTYLQKYKAVDTTNTIKEKIKIIDNKTCEFYVNGELKTTNEIELVEGSENKYTLTGTENYVVLNDGYLCYNMDECTDDPYVQR